MVWSDPTPQSLPSSTVLVNDLDVRLIKNGSTTYTPWILNPNIPESAATTGDNTRDNVEQIFLQTPGAGYYTVTISPKKNFTQNFSLILTGFVEPYKTIILKQIGSDDQPFGQAAYWENMMWNYVGPTQPVTRPLLNKQYFLSTQNFKPGTVEKFQFWKDNENRIRYRNWDTMTILSSTNEVLCQFQPTANVFIKNYLENFASVTENVVDFLQFKDPWLVDYNEQPYNLRSRGLDAPLVTVQSPLNITLSSGYKGVFLNQGNDWQPPYYSVGGDPSYSLYIPSSGRTHYFHFLNWQANPAAGAEFQNALSTSTPVVFKQDNTTISAVYKGTELSNSWSTYDNNSQRNYVRVKNNLLYSTYVSMDKLFVEEKIPNGTWTLMNSGKPIIDNDVFSSSMDYINNSANEDDKLLMVVTSKTSANYPVIYARYLNAATETVHNGSSSPFWQSDYIHAPEDFQPVIAVSGSDKFLTVFRKIENEYSGLYFFSGTITDNSIIFADSAAGLPWYIQGTNQYSVNPTISVSKTAANEPVYWIAWQQLRQRSIYL